ncbi:MAG: autotransporter-associated beta strand repeat-containing protein [Thermoguttaceae bacterium]
MFVLGLSAKASTVRSVGAYNITFYNAGDGDDGGTGSQNWTSSQIEDVVACVATWNSRITNPYGRQVQLHLFWNNLVGSTLGQTSNLYSGDGTTVWSNTELVWREGENYSIPTGYDYDARMAFNTNFSWNSGTGTPSSSQYDLRSVVTHELGHTLGFYSTYISDTSDPNYDKFSPYGLSEWDKLLVDKSGNKPVAGGIGTPNDFKQTDNPVYFTGPLAEAAYEAYLHGSSPVPVPVYAPTSYISGSSLSHLDLSDALMRPAMTAGSTTRAPMALEWGIIKDLGWSVTDLQTWTKGAGTLTWTDTANWNPGVVPGSNYNVSFTNTGISSGDTIVLGGDRTINALTIDSTTDFTIGGTSGTLTLNGGYITRSTTSAGTQTISRPLTVGANTVWDIGGTGSLTITGSLTVTGSSTATKSITKIGSGTVVLSAAATVPNNMIIDDGDLTLAPGGSLTTGNIYGTAGSLNIDGGSLTVTLTSSIHLYGFRVGKTGTGSFTLASGKSLTADTFLTIGRDSGGNGTFYNNGGTITASTNLFVGANSGSTGSFTQQSGSTAVSSNTYIGNSSGSTGTININGGTLTTPFLYSGYGGTGTFTQSGGSVNASTETYAGYNNGSNGTININGGTFTTPYIYSGFGGTGAFTQSVQSVGSTVNVTIATVVGNSIGSNGSLTIHNGSFTTPTIYMCYSGGTGAIYQYGGTVNVSNATYIGYHSGSTASLTISGGTYSSTNIFLAYPGTGTITLTGGTLKSSGLIKGAGNAYFYFGGGILQATASFLNDCAVALSLTGVNGNATIDTQGYAVTFSKSVTGTGGLTKTGTGVLTFSSTVNYSGDTSISAGTLKFLGSTSVVGDITGTGTLVVGNGTSSSALTADSITIGTLNIGVSTTAATSLLSDDSQSLNTDLAAVPEPSAAILLLMAGLIVMAYHKRGTAIW